MCLKCNKPSGRMKYCRECTEFKRNASAILCQNVRKMKKLLHSNRFNKLNFEKFLLYASNIIDKGRILIEFQDCDELRKRLLIDNYRI